MLVVGALIACVGAITWTQRTEPAAVHSISDHSEDPERNGIGRSAIDVESRLADATLDSLADESGRTASEFRKSEPDGADFSAADEISVWQSEIAGLTATDLFARSDALIHELQITAIKPLKALVDADIYQVVGRGCKIHFTTSRDNEDPQRVYEDPDEICGYKLPGISNPQGIQRKYTLSKEQYPELYRMKRHALWLRQQGEALARH